MQGLVVPGVGTQDAYNTQYNLADLHTKYLSKDKMRYLSELHHLESTMDR